MEVLNALLITENDRTVVVERGGEQVALTLPLDELIAMRQERGYENLFVLWQPFIIDSVLSPGAAPLQRGDEIVAIRTPDGQNYGQLQFRDSRALLKLHAGDTLRFTLLRDGAPVELDLPVSDEGTLGVLTLNPYTPRTRTTRSGSPSPQVSARRAGPSPPTGSSSSSSPSPKPNSTRRSAASSPSAAYSPAAGTGRISGPRPLFCRSSWPS